VCGLIMISQTAAGGLTLIKFYDGNDERRANEPPRFLPPPLSPLGFYDFSPFSTTPRERERKF